MNNYLKLVKGTFFANEIHAVTNDGRIVMKFGDWVSLEDIKESLSQYHYDTSKLRMPK